MARYFAQIEIDEAEVTSIMDRLEKAKEEIYKCYDELRTLGVVKFIENNHANEDTDRIDYEIQADDCTELTDADKEILERLDYFISNDDNLKEISIIPCNEKKIVLNSMMEVERFIAIIQDRSRLVFDT